MFLNLPNHLFLFWSLKGISVEVIRHVPMNITFFFKTAQFFTFYSSLCSRAAPSIVMGKSADQTILLLVVCLGCPENVWHVCMPP